MYVDVCVCSLLLFLSLCTFVVDIQPDPDPVIEDLIQICVRSGPVIWRSRQLVQCRLDGESDWIHVISYECLFYLSIIFVRFILSLHVSIYLSYALSWYLFRERSRVVLIFIYSPSECFSFKKMIIVIILSFMSAI